MATMEELRSKHDAQVENNRELGVIDYTSGQKQSDAVYEVTDGRKYLPKANGKQVVLGPGNLFRPTEAQVASGSLKGKAREVSGSVLRGLGASPHRVAGADIGIRALPMAESTIKRALHAGMVESDFDGVKPEGQDGQYTFRQVEAMVAARQEEAN